MWKKGHGEKSTHHSYWCWWLGDDPFDIFVFGLCLPWSLPWLVLLTSPNAQNFHLWDVLMQILHLWNLLAQILSQTLGSNIIVIINIDEVAEGFHEASIFSLTSTRQKILASRVVGPPVCSTRPSWLSLMNKSPTVLSVVDKHSHSSHSSGSRCLNRSFWWTSQAEAVNEGEVDLGAERIE